MPLELDGLFDIILRLTSCGAGRARIAPGARFLGVVTFFNAIPDFLKTAPLLILIVCSVSFTILDVYGLYLLRFLSPVRCITIVGGADTADKSALRPISDSTPGQLSVRPIAAMGVVYSSHYTRYQIELLSFSPPYAASIGRLALVHLNKQILSGSLFPSFRFLTTVFQPNS